MFVIINQKEFCDYISYFFGNSHYYMTMSRLFDTQNSLRLMFATFTAPPIGISPLKMGTKLITNVLFNTFL